MAQTGCSPPGAEIYSGNGTIRSPREGLTATITWDYGPDPIKQSSSDEVVDPGARDGYRPS